MVWNPKKPSNRKWGWLSRRRSTGKIPARAIPRSIARVRRDWVTLYNPQGTVGCEYISAPYTAAGEGLCRSSFTINVMSATELSELYGDDVKVERIVGSLWLRPWFDMPLTPCNQTAMSNYRDQLRDWVFWARGGLFKQRVVSSDRQFDGVTSHPSDNQDWSDAGWLQTFDRTWTAPPMRWSEKWYNDSSLMGVNAEVKRDQYTVPETASGDQPQYNVPAITTTTCEPCFSDEGECGNTGWDMHLTAPGWKRVSINRRRPIHLREDDAVRWDIDWGPLKPPDGLCGEITTQPPCSMHIIPSMKLLIQYG